MMVGVCVVMMAVLDSPSPAWLACRTQLQCCGPSLGPISVAVAMPHRSPAILPSRPLPFYRHISVPCLGRLGSAVISATSQVMTVLLSAVFGIEALIHEIGKGRGGGGEDGEGGGGGRGGGGE